MNSLRCNLPQVRLSKPQGLAPRLFFSAYHGPNAVAYAQLSSRAQNKFQRAANDAPDENSHEVPGVSYCLKLIEVQESYRNQGIGSALLEEVIRFCKEERVNTLYGEAKGDLEILRQWYSDKGFQIDRVDNIQLSLI
ncbi:MAG: GNAT family N-acetyltransferase [Gammaproteobacteria bacterium]